MKKIRTLIVDDEPLARDGIAVLLAEDPEVEVLGSCGDSESAHNAIREQKPDLVFLDIHLPKRSGLELLAQLPPEERPLVVFVTAHDTHAVKAFELSATDYILKPFRTARFREALARAKSQIRGGALREIQVRSAELIDRLRELEARQAPLPAPARGDSRLAVKVRNEHVFLEVRDIIWVEAQGESVKVQTVTISHSVREPFHRFEQRLDAREFVRIHRSFLVNVARVKKIVPAMYGDYDVYTSDGSKLRMSRTYRSKLSQLLSPAP